MSEKNRILVYLASVARETRILVCLASVAQQTRSLVQLASESRQTRSLVQLASPYFYYIFYIRIYFIIILVGPITFQDGGSGYQTNKRCFFCVFGGFFLLAKKIHEESLKKNLYKIHLNYKLHILYIKSKEIKCTFRKGWLFSLFSSYVEKI